MTKNFTLDDIRAAAEEKYGSSFLTLDNGVEVELVNLLRLPKDKRQVIMNISKDKDSIEDSDIDETCGRLLEGLVAACRTQAQGKALEKAIGGDNVFIMETFTLYMGGTQAGEAEPSQD